VEAAIRGEESVGGKDVEVRVENEVVAESVDGGDAPEFAVGEIEAGAEGVAEGLIRPPRMAGSPFGLRLRLRPKRLRPSALFGGGVEEVAEELAALAEDAAQDFGDGEDELAVGDFVADGGGNPVAGGADAALMAGWAEVAALAGEGE
jgi:hypothetical protein